MDLSQRVVELLGQGETICVATVVQTNDPELASGAKFLFRRGAPPEGDPPAGALGERLSELAEEALGRKKRHLKELAPGVRVFFDVLSPEVKLLICGAGHIAVPLARFAREVGFHVTVLDDRPDFASPTRFPGCDVVAEDFAPTLRALTLGSDTFAVVITRGHEHDLECLLEILPKDTAYVGLIGSRRRVGFVKIALEQQGIPAEKLNRLHAPIGLPIGAESPAEIALCIAAELVAVRRKGTDGARAVRGEKKEQS